ncbi:hypothetical protein BDW42DRAFT_35313 [Aspergillus taichungensis]|uniref:Uncharacterized protein n=1 Tax=Aspergillus taichungensis TaxID=482145 RepID=A0A2J5I3U4_9EURO|nr:hypothetical protein BDW42DRAFT_35313 [Aspergillus taichungensis]
MWYPYSITPCLWGIRSWLHADGRGRPVRCRRMSCCLVRICMVFLWSVSWFLSYLLPASYLLPPTYLPPEYSIPKATWYLAICSCKEISRQSSRRLANNANASGEPVNLGRRDYSCLASFK